MRAGVDQGVQPACTLVGQQERSTGLNPHTQEARLARLHLHPSPKQRPLRPRVLPPSAVSEPPWPWGKESRNRGHHPPPRTRSFIWKDVA